MRSSFVLMFIAGCVAELASVAYAQPAQPKAPAGKVEPEKVLEEMADFVGGLPAFSCNAESSIGITAQGQSNDSVTKLAVRLERPNRLAMIVTQGTMGLTIVSDGKQLTQYLPMTKRYVVTDAPPTLEGMTDIGVPVPITMMGAANWVVPVDAKQFFASLMEGVTKSEYLGEEKVGDPKTGEVLCHHCRFIQEDYDWDIWIEVGKRPLVHKVQPDLSKQLAAAGAQTENLKISYVISFRDWNIAPKFTEDDFKFTPPPGAKQSDTLFEQPEEPVHPLLGEPAPAFETTDVEGTPIDLKKSIGKNVILLDFWATWCGPCVQAMPQVEEVATKFKEKGLVFHAVNVGEDAETIKAFLAEAKMEVPVAMDMENKISELYKVQGIPQTLLIGKDGKVQVVHVGFSPQLAKALTSEIEDLLAGKDLATAALQKAEEAKAKREAEAESNTPPEQPAPPEPPSEAESN